MPRGELASLDDTKDGVESQVALTVGDGSPRVIGLVTQGHVDRRFEMLEQLVLSTARENREENATQRHILEQTRVTVAGNTERLDGVNRRLDKVNGRLDEHEDRLDAGDDFWGRKREEAAKREGQLWLPRTMIMLLSSMRKPENLTLAAVLSSMTAVTLHWIGVFD